MDPVAIVLGVASAISWGGADFAGGLASRSIGAIATAAASQGIGVVVLAGVVLLAAETAPGGTEVAWSAAAGIGGAIGLATFYRALALGTMSLVAPLAGAIGAGVPVAVSLVLGERIGPAQAAGVACGLAAVIAVSLDARRGGERWSVLPLVVAAGLGFAVFYVAIDRAIVESGHTWQPLLIARASALALFVLVLVLVAGGRVPLAAVARRLPLILAVGLGDLGGNLFFVLADARAPLSIAVVLSSLYPVTTAVLAWLLLGERPQRIQLAGAVLAVVAIALMAA